jgi:RNA polymerase sigma-70 factor (ECF subfamily)
MTAVAQEQIPIETEPFVQFDTGELNRDFEDLVEKYYQPLYKFALSLARSEADACDLTQHTFYTWRIKGEQLRDSSKVKAWLFTTLHRAFLQGRRHESRFPHFELNEVDPELPSISPRGGTTLDSEDVLNALAKIDELFRAPLALCYLEDCPYKEIAAMLGIPLGTVKSRIARGITQLKAMLTRTDYRAQDLAA